VLDAERRQQPRKRARATGSDRRNEFFCRDLGEALEREQLLDRERVQVAGIGDETRIVAPGSLFIIPPNVPHRAVAVGGPAVVLDVFSPVREDYAEMANRYIPTVSQ